MSGGLSWLVPSPTKPCGLGPPFPAVRERRFERWRPSPAPRERVQSAARRVRVFARLGLCALVLSLALAGCGKKGPPTAPPDEPNTYPRPYPSE